MRKVSPYEIEISQKLKHSKKPFAYRMGEFLLMPQVGDIQILRTFSDCIIELEQLNDKSSKELVSYKMRYGDIEEPEKCTWKINHENSDYIGETWDTSCNHVFQFMEGDIQENNFEYCPFCGKVIGEDR